MKKSRRWLYLVLCAGLIALGAGGGTFASFNATTTNKTNTFSTGTLTLKESATCKSTKGATNHGPSGTCSALLTVATTPGLEPGAVRLDTLSLANTGTLTASTLTVAATGSCAHSGSVGTITPGNLCTKLDFFVEEVGQHTGADTTTFTKCWYGCTSVTKITLTTSITEGSAVTGTTLHVAALPGAVAKTELISLTTGSHSEVVKAETAAAKTATSIKVEPVTTPTGNPSKWNFSYSTGSIVVALSGTATVKTFCTTDTPTTPLALSALSASTTAKTTRPALKAKETRKFLVGLYLPYTTGNRFQGQTAKFSLTWKITQ